MKNNIFIKFVIILFIIGACLDELFMPVKQKGFSEYALSGNKFTYFGVVFEVIWFIYCAIMLNFFFISILFLIFSLIGLLHIAELFPKDKI